MSAHEYGQELKCPYCNYVIEDEWEHLNYEEGEQEIECPDCGKKFDAEVNISYSFSSKRKPCVDEKHSFVLSQRYFGNPYINKGKNWTIYECENCDEKKYKVGPLSANGEPYVMPVDAKEQP